MRNVSNMLLLVLTGVLIVTGVAQAMLVTHNTAAVFEDDFEADTLNVAPNNPAIGSWATEAYGNSQIVVTDAAVPGSIEGDKYLKLYDDGTCNTHAKFTDQTITAGTLRIEYMSYIPEDDSSAVFALTQDTSGIGLNGALFWVVASSGNTVGSYDGSTVNDTGVDWIIGAWQKWVFDVNLDTGKFTVSVGGSTSSELDLWRPDNIAKNFVFRGGKSGETFYVDAIPEPATISILALAGLGILRRKK